MKKITFAVLALMASGSAFAATTNAPKVYDAKTGSASMVAPVNAASNYVYTVDADATKRLFVKNNFDFTLSANTIIQTAEQPVTGTYMGVVTANSRGRNIFTGHSDGGSVTTCDDPLSAADAKTLTNFTTAMTSRFVITEVTNSACKPS